MLPLDQWEYIISKLKLIDLLYHNIQNLDASKFYVVVTPQILIENLQLISLLYVDYDYAMHIQGSLNNQMLHPVF